jgi:hypothetical protein
MHFSLATNEIFMPILGNAATYVEIQGPSAFTSKLPGHLQFVQGDCLYDALCE